MLILAVETATSRQSVALVQDSEVLAKQEWYSVGSHSRQLIPTIDGVLAPLGFHIQDLNGIAVSIGPGSFTGLRVGLATVAGFRLVSDVRVVAVPTLEAMAWNLYGETKLLCPILRSRVGEVYWALFQWKNNQLVRISEDHVGGFSTLAESIDEPVLVYGEGWLANREALQVALESYACEPDGIAMQVSAVSVAKAGLLLLKAGQYAELGLTPRYVQRSEAEIVLERKARQLADIS